ncbi:hypothetical protein [Halobacteriaceae bacterium SHR40]|uniref:hypothetical protein n=1 Tax=Halovenus amylolytica TaxID=2500550 RepID=UPI000FE42408
MVELTNTEHEQINTLVTCIAEAMAETGIDPAYANKTKLQKLLYLAVDEFDLSITYSWYLAGAVLPGDQATPNTLETAFSELAGSDSHSTLDDITEESLDSFTAADDKSTSADTLSEEFSTEARPDDGATIDPVLFSDSPESESESNSLGGSGEDLRTNDIIDFYISELPNVWHQNTMRFLQNFYLAHAPDAYRDLYVQSTHLRIHLRDIEEAIEAHLTGETPEESIDDLVRSVGLEISDLHCTIQTAESLSPTFDGVVAGTDVIEDGLMMLSKRDPDQLDEAHLEAIQSMQEFYYYYVWRYPCLVISQETATGPSAGILREERQQQLSDFNKQLQARIETFEAELDDAGLLPEYSDYPAGDDKMETAFRNLAADYFGN